MPAGWSVYRGKGFSVNAPGNPTRPNIPFPDQLQVDAYQFLYPQDSGGAIVMLMTYIGSAPFDIEAGADGACENAVKNVGGKMDKFERTTIDGKSGREFSFSAKIQNRMVKGRGRAIVTSPKSAAMAMGFYDASRRDAAAKNDSFVTSFKVE